MKKRNYYDEDQEEEDADQTDATTTDHAERQAPHPRLVQKALKNTHTPSSCAPSNKPGAFVNCTATVPSNSHFAIQRDMWREQHGDDDHEHHHHHHHHIHSEMQYHSDAGSRDHADHVMLSGHSNYPTDYNAVMSLTLHHPYGCSTDESFLDESHLGAPEQEARWLKKTFETMYSPTVKEGCHSSLPQDDNGTKSRTSPALFKMEHDAMSGDTQGSRAWQQGCLSEGMAWDQAQFMMQTPTFDSDMGRYPPRPAPQEGPQKCTVMYHYV
jgi:hypothetical protein